jgi:hypothetical protein
MLEDEAVLGDTVEKDDRLGQEIVERHGENLIRIGSTRILLPKGLHLRSIFALVFHCGGQRLCTSVWQVFVLKDSNEPRLVYSYTRSAKSPFWSPFLSLDFQS